MIVKIIVIIPITIVNVIIRSLFLSLFLSSFLYPALTCTFSISPLVLLFSTAHFLHHNLIKKPFKNLVEITAILYNYVDFIWLSTSKFFSLCFCIHHNLTNKTVTVPITVILKNYVDSHCVLLFGIMSMHKFLNPAVHLSDTIPNIFLFKYVLTYDNPYNNPPRPWRVREEDES